MERGTVSWVKHRGRALAYETLGRGSTDVLLLDYWFTNLDLAWDDVSDARVFRRFAASSRLIRWDRSGMGLSDRRPPDSGDALAEWADEAVSVLDAVGAASVAVAAFGWTGPIALALAGRHPSRVSRLALHDTFAKPIATTDDPIGVDPALADAGRQLVLDRWGHGAINELLGIGDEIDIRRQQGRFERNAVTPGDLESLVDAFLRCDARPYLADIEAETLVLYNPPGPDRPDSDVFVTQAQSELLAQLIPGARLSILDPRSWAWPLASDALPARVEEAITFLSGEAIERSGHRRLLTFAFLDVVGSTTLVSALGDQHWDHVLEHFTADLHRVAEEEHGRVAGSAGDGFLLLFEAPSRAVAACDGARRAAKRLGIGIRMGVHTGECEERAGDVSGIAVHAAARIMSAAQNAQLLASQTVKDILEEQFRFTSAGEHILRGVPGSWPLYEVEPL